jgi:2-methylcitrate dehydratase PrpD
MTGKLIETPSLTQLAAQRLKNVAESDISPKVRRKAWCCLLDHIGACIQGLQAPWAIALLNYAERNRGVPQAYQWGLPFKVNAETAAFTNGAIGHSVIRDDMHLASGSHIGVLVIPAALALAQRDDWSGRALIRGIVGGYEMAARLGAALQVGIVNPHFRPSGITGPFGAASAAIVGANLDKEIAVHVLGFAANAGAGVNQWPWDGGQEIYTHAGNAARAGISAFDLAQAGMTSSVAVLEGKDGFFAAFGAGSKGSEAFEAGLRSSDEFGIMSTTFKPFAGCNYIQTPIAAALKAGQQIHGRTDDIRGVTIRTFAAARDYPGCNSSGPMDSVQQTKMSIQYSVSSALLFGHVDEETYRQFSNQELLRLIGCCSIDIDPDYDSLVSKGMQPAAVEVQLSDGTVYSAALADVPWLGENEVIERFQKESAGVLLATRQKLVSLADELWESEDCSALFEALGSSVLL